MKIGDLVELSAKGSQLKYCREFIGMVGVVSGMDFSTEYGKKPWYYIDWCGGKNTPPSQNRPQICEQKVMKIGALVSNKELGRGLVMENTGAGWLVYWYERGDSGKLFKTVICKTNTYPPHWACGGGFGSIAILSLGGQQ